MQTLTDYRMASVTAGGDACEATLAGIFAFGSAFVAVPVVGIVGGVAMGLSAGLWAFGGCGRK